MPSIYRSPIIAGVKVFVFFWILAVFDRLQRVGRIPSWTYLYGVYMLGIDVKYLFRLELGVHK